MVRRTTLRDIAEALELSVSTVSLALRGHPRIPASTAERIRRTALSMGYIYNRAAADLRKSESRLVAVCLNDLSNPVFNEFLMQIEDELRRHDRTVFLGVAHEDIGLQRDILTTALEHGVSGVVLCPVHGTRAGDIDMLFPAGPNRAPSIPAVIYSRQIEGVALPQFVNDDRRAGHLAAACLIAHGHRRIAWIGGGQESSTATGRFEGCCDALAEMALPPPVVLNGPTSREFGRQAVLDLMSENAPPTGLVCFSDLIAFGALLAIRELGLQPGHDLSVVGCDDMDEAGFSWPGLTTIRVNKRGIGRAAARCLLEERVPGVVQTAPELIMRGTVGPPRGADFGMSSG